MIRANNLLSDHHLGALDEHIQNGQDFYIFKTSGGAIWGFPSKRKQLNSITVRPSHRLAQWALCGLKYGLPIGKFSQIQKIHISKILTDALNTLAGFTPTSMSFYIGSPGAYRKALFFLESESQTSVVLKWSLWLLADSFVIQEATNLKKLNNNPALNKYVPALISSGLLENRQYLLMKSLSGKFGSYYLQDYHWRFAELLWKSNKKKYLWQESSFACRLRENVARLSPMREDFSILSSAMSYLEKELNGKRLPFGWAHCDFTPWNIYVNNNDIRVLDWERSIQCAPPGYDLLHFIAMQYALKNIVITSFPSGFSNWIKTVAPSWLGLEKSILTAYLLDQFVFYTQARFDYPSIGNDVVVNWTLANIKEILAGARAESKVNVYVS